MLTTIGDVMIKEYEKEYRVVNSPIVFTTRKSEKELLISKIVYSIELFGAACSFLFVVYVLGPRGSDFVNWVQAVL
jgi:hypothetical protein